MTIAAMLDELLKKALTDDMLRQELLKSRDDQNPVSAFCSICRTHGYDIYEMDLIGEGEGFYAEIRRSTNGGGENSPGLTGADDFYEVFFADLTAAGK